MAEGTEGSERASAGATARGEVVMHGLALSSGVAVGRVCLFNDRRHADLPRYRVDGEGVEAELSRLEQALEIAAGKLDLLQEEVRTRIGPAEAEIFVAQRMILADESLARAIEDTIRAQGTNAEAAAATVLEEHEARLLEVDDEYIKERSSDFGEVRRRILDVLSGVNPSLVCTRGGHCQHGRGRVVVAEELTPTLAIELDAEHTLGFVTERGGANSHAAILARALGIPAVSGIAGIHGRIPCGTEVLVNGHTGELVLAPADWRVARLRARYPESTRMPAAVPRVAGLSVMANISGEQEIDLALEMQCEGVGLYRTEFEFITAGRSLSEDEQYERYARVVEAMGGRPVTFRLLDIGGDKPVSFLAIPREENPYLGWRGSRILLDRKDLLRAQARALTRASVHGPVHVLYPMVIDLPQFRRLRADFDSAIEGLPRGVLRHGAMFEVPSACLGASGILEEADFGSIGTNDLIQYLFAVDRNNELVASDYDPDRPALWDLIEAMVSEAARQGKPLSVCGELAGDPRHVYRLMQAGVSAISVSPRLIPDVRRAALLGSGGSFSI